MDYREEDKILSILEPTFEEFLEAIKNTEHFRYHNKWWPKKEWEKDPIRVQKEREERRRR